MPNRLPFFMPLFAVVLLSSCPSGYLSFVSGRAPDPDRIRVMTWNAQTFFDDAECGAEFDEFRGEGSDWTAARYDERLDRLAEGILLAGRRAGMESGLGPDVVALEEIENGRVLRDLCNRLPGAGYGHAAFVPPTEGGAFGVAVLSRYSILSLSSHTPYSPDVSLRPLLEVTLDAPCGPFVVFVVHWKSKLGDGEGESLRVAQERVLRERIEAVGRDFPGRPFVACGDFNCGPDETDLAASYPGFWERYGGNGGSYWYGGAWERIDNALWPESLESGGSWRVSRVVLLDEPPLLGANGRPASYVLRLGTGYSDHLPLLIEMSRGNRD